ncbi:MAG: phosphatase PAP2 family protein [Thermoanaerobaculia bacterium]
MIIAGFVLLFLILWAIFYASLPALRHLGRVAAAFAARFTRVERIFTSVQKRFRNYIPVAVIVVAGALLTAWVGHMFLDLALLVHSKSTALEQVDTNIHDWAVTRRGGEATMFFVAMTILGGPVGLAVLLTSVAVLLAVKHRWRWLTYLAVTAVGGALLNLGLKQYFARSRPAVAEMLRRAHGYSFPSGHAMGSAVAFSALAYLAMRSARGWPVKAAILSLALTLTAAVALSRVYLGVHWLSDVGAGVTAGLVWASSTTIAYETLRRIRMLRALRRQAAMTGGTPLSPQG